jgi:hypothetical protein
VVWVVSVEAAIRDRGFESWLVNRVAGWLSARGVRLPEFIMCEMQLVPGGVRFRLHEVVETGDGDWVAVGVLYEASFSHQEIEYLYREYLEERAARLDPIAG